MAAVPHAGGAGGWAGAQAEGALLPQAQRPPTGEAQARGLGPLEQGGGVEVGGVGFRLWKAAVGLGPVEEAAGEEVPPSCCVWRDPHWAPSPPQDVDSRGRRRRELGPPESQQPREQPEPSTSWWPVSSAEKKKNFTLVRAGPTRSGRDSGRGGGMTDVGARGARGASGGGQPGTGVMARPLRRAAWTCHSWGAAAAAPASPAPTRCSLQTRALSYS